MEKSNAATPFVYWHQGRDGTDGRATRARARGAADIRRTSECGHDIGARLSHDCAQVARAGSGEFGAPMNAGPGEHRQGTWDRRGRGARRVMAVLGPQIATGTRSINHERCCHVQAARTDRTSTQRHLAKRTV